MRYFEAPDGRRLAYRDSGGTGAPVLCLAGLTRNSRDFDALACHLAPRHRVIRLDSRGRGASDHAADPATEYTVPVETGDALALLSRLGLDRVAVIGTSRGGILGMAMAAGQPGLVRALVLNDVGAVIEMRGLLHILARLDRAPEDPDFESAARRLAEENAAAFPDVPLARWRIHARAIFDEVEGRPRLAHDPRLRTAAAAVDDDAATISLWPLFEGIGATPVLVIRGETSDILSRETVAAMAAHHPGLWRVEIPGRGHAPFLDEPGALAAIDPFLAEHGA